MTGWKGRTLALNPPVSHVTEIAALSNLKTAPGHLAVRGEPDRTP